MGKPCRPGACASRIALALVFVLVLRRRICRQQYNFSAANYQGIDIRKMPVSEAKRGYPVRLKGAIDQAGRHRKRNRIAR